MAVDVITLIDFWRQSARQSLIITDKCGNYCAVSFQFRFSGLNLSLVYSIFLHDLTSSFGEHQSSSDSPVLLWLLIFPRTHQSSNQNSSSNSLVLGIPGHLKRLTSPPQTHQSSDSPVLFRLTSPQTHQSSSDLPVFFRLISSRHADSPVLVKLISPLQTH